MAFGLTRREWSITGRSLSGFYSIKNRQIPVSVADLPPNARCFGQIHPAAPATLEQVWFKLNHLTAAILVSGEAGCRPWCHPTTSASQRRQGPKAPGPKGGCMSAHRLRCAACRVEPICSHQMIQTDRPFALSSGRVKGPRQWTIPGLPHAML